MGLEGVAKAKSEVGKEAPKIAKGEMKNLDRPLNVKEIKETKTKDMSSPNKIKDLDKPLNRPKIEKTERMEPPKIIEFKCPDGVDKKEFIRQLKGQERGLNSQTVAENMKNRNEFLKRKMETGNGRDLESGKKAQDIQRQKALQSRIDTNQKKGMSYKEAKAEAEGWIKTQAALHNPDQIAGGDPSKVSRMGDAKVNASIGSQWRTKVKELEAGINEYAKGKSPEELARTKLNVRLVAV